MLAKLVKFSTTPRMSTDLVAFAVGEFDFVESRTSSSVNHRAQRSQYGDVCGHHLLLFPTWLHLFFVCHTCERRFYCPKQTKAAAEGQRVVYFFCLWCVCACARCGARVWGAGTHYVGQGGEGEFALDVATRTQDFFDENFASPYLLPKLELIAVPDFAAARRHMEFVCRFCSVFSIFRFLFFGFLLLAAIVMFELRSPFPSVTFPKHTNDLIYKYGRRPTLLNYPIA